MAARGVVINNKQRKPELQKILDSILKGVVSVPALLLTNPTQPLVSLNLSRYETMASEPLHDIKGHAINLITELPHLLLHGEAKDKCKALIDHSQQNDK